MVVVVVVVELSYELAPLLHCWEGVGYCASPCRLVVVAFMRAEV